MSSIICISHAFFWPVRQESNIVKTIVRDDDCVDSDDEDVIDLTPADSSLRQRGTSAVGIAIPLGTSPTKKSVKKPEVISM